MCIAIIRGELILSPETQLTSTSTRSVHLCIAAARDAMQLVNVSLPDLHLVGDEQQMNLSLRGTLQLRFPDGVDVPTTSSDLLKLVTEKHLWIARTGSCYLRLDVSIQGEPVSERNHVAKLVKWREAFTAEFESVSCHIDLSPNKDGVSLKKRPLKRKRAKQASECIEIQQPDDVFADDEHLADLTPDDQRAIDAFIQSLNMMPVRQRQMTSEIFEFSESLGQLFEVALEMIVLGSRKQYRGIATVHRTHAECLIRLAPAVFNRPYLKTISDRVSLLPIIATSLARMKNAESPSLRQKAASFAARVTDVGCDYNDRVIRGIEKSTWDVLLSTVKIPTLSRKGSHGVQRLTSNTEPGSGSGFCEHSTPLQAVEKEEKEDIGVITTWSSTHGQTENHEIKQSLLPPHNPIFLECRQVGLPEVQASSASLSPGSPICYTQAEPSYISNSSGMDSKALMGEGIYEHPFTVDAVVWNHDLWPMDQNVGGFNANVKRVEM
ncbi:uncharacterized protein Triagg1_4679 [Trichoderma aggressivum f. europaeum]|uniref:Uncharacterized protein n=1 Tax=Trichoderma aggressivum f. europaeum TaxID=173218 RepID=A0AAE1M0Z5_9HYPO|nr:hypothetical protein Triagg1_4679 [Trichoderma aggressivum f. europaeum]